MNFPQVRHANGFSLPEVTIAVGIAALGLVTLLGLMPQGLEMARKTGELAAQREIVEQITRDLEQTSWTELETLSAGATGVTKAFSDQGIEVQIGDRNTSYIVNVQVFSLNAQLPQGGGGNVRKENFLRKVITRVATTTNPSFPFDEPSNRQRVATFNTYIARSF